MKRFVYSMMVICAGLMLSSCAKAIVDLTGNIQGTIKDYNNGFLLSNCMVSLSPGGKSLTSSSSGTYEFTDLSAGDYTLTFTKAGYIDEKINVSVLAGETVTSDVLLKSKAAFAISEDSYDFGDLEATKVFYFFNNSDGDCSYEISNIPDWISFSRTRGTVPAAGNEAVTATVFRDKVSEGSYNQNVTVSYSGKSSGAVNLHVKMTKVKLGPPSVTIASAGQNIKENSFDIGGTITATGGSQILSYGHCWSTSMNPTVENNKTDLGTTDAIGAFTSTASNLSVFTTYYVRAYARNAQGIAYSEEIAVTTQNVESDVWDGNIASSFAGGSGTYSDPYIVKTGGQLLLMKNYSDSYFVLDCNIDLNNINWKPFEFYGTLDGKGFSIMNLKISRNEDNLGIFSTNRGFISNLSIQQVVIEASSNSNIGSLCGLKEKTIENCHVVLGSNSKILGNEYVGGLVGQYTSNSSCHISGCSVTSTANNDVIKGSYAVGGLIGGTEYHSKLLMSDCHVNANISGANTVGGIVGANSSDYVGSEINKCSFSGKVSGEDGVGGITGLLANESTITSCKVDAQITATKGMAGGLSGSHISHSNICRLSFIACYVKGTITGDPCYAFCRRGAANLCYSTLTSTSSTYKGLGDPDDWRNTDWSVTDCATIQNCSDITTYLKECYSSYASYWDFNNTWIWDGTINGQSVTVSCPKLAWE